MRKRIIGTQDNYSYDADDADSLPPVDIPRPNLTSNATYDTKAPEVNDAISRSIDRAFYPLRYKNEIAHKHKSD